jgi:serine/threonine-protein kinase
MIGALLGLHAAHEAKNERGELLGLVHRDVSPENILVGADGVARVLDFGVAKAAGRLQFTRDARVVKGKPSYMAPEQIVGDPVDRRCDVFAAGIVLWELLANRHLFRGDSDTAIFHKALTAEVPAPSTHVPGTPPAVDEIVMRALSRTAESRFADARQMALALEAAAPPATSRQLGEWVEETARDSLAARTRAVAEFESLSFDDEPPTRQISSMHGKAEVDPPTVAYRRSSKELTRPEALAISVQLQALVEPAGAAAEEPPELETSSATRVRVTQLSSSSSVPRGGSSADNRPVGWGMVALATLVALFVGGGVAAWLTRTSAAPSSEGPSAAAKAPAQSVPVAPIASSPASNAVGSVPSPSAIPSGTPSGVASAAPLATVAPLTPAAAAKDRPEATTFSRPVQPAPATTRATRPNVQRASDPCDPPWTKDAEGIRHAKPECL